jgi:RNA polymerase sigma factor (sigma-70 family)
LVDAANRPAQAPSPVRVRFEALAMPHLDAAYNLARWLSRDEHDARDIVQDAFLRAFVSFANLRGEDARPWLLAIVRNTCFTWLGRNRTGGAASGPDEERADETQPGPEERAVQAQERRRVNAALRALPPDLREVLVLREFEDLSYREIAQVIDVPIGTVMSRLARARGRLAGEFARESARRE